MTLTAEIQPAAGKNNANMSLGNVIESSINIIVKQSWQRCVCSGHMAWNFEACGTKYFLLLAFLSTTTTTITTTTITTTTTTTNNNNNKVLF